MLMGTWSKNGHGWQAKFDPTAPTARMQNMIVSITAAQGEVMEVMRKQADWQGLAGLLEAQ